MELAFWRTFKVLRKLDPGGADVLLTDGLHVEDVDGRVDVPVGLDEEQLRAVREPDRELDVLRHGGHESTGPCGKIEPLDGHLVDGQVAAVR